MSKMIKPTDNKDNRDGIATNENFDASDKIDAIDNVEKAKQAENKKENRKALKVFIPILIGAGLIGGVCGFLIVFLQNKGITLDIVALCKDGIFYVSPWGVVLCGLLGALLTQMCFGKAKNRYEEAMKQAEGGEIDEVEAEIIDDSLSKGMMVLSIFMILEYMFFGFVMINLDRYIDLIDIWTMVIVLIFIIFAFIDLKQQQKMVDLEKVLNPEKSGSVYDMKFKKKWEESCDEMEKMMIYKSAYKAYSACQMACVALWIVFAMLGMALKAGVLPIIAVTVLWLTLTVTYMLEARKLGKKK